MKGCLCHGPFISHATKRRNGGRQLTCMLEFSSASYVSSLSFQRRRPYRVECTGSLPTSEVKRRRARLVLGWGTAREHLRVLSAFARVLGCCRLLLVFFGTAQGAVVWNFRAIAFHSSSSSRVTFRSKHPITHSDGRSARHCPYSARRYPVPRKEERTKREKFYSPLHTKERLSL